MRRGTWTARHPAWRAFSRAGLTPLWRRIRWQMIVDFLLVMLAAVILIKTSLMLLGIAA